MTFNEANKENVEKSRLIHEGLLDPTDYEKKYTLLRKYITRGGFIKDKNDRWCKDGDKVQYKESEYGREHYAALEYSEGSFFVKRISDGITDIYYPNDMLYGFELIEPCEPDICKDFEEVEL